ncbi:MAG: carbohydrate porin [Limisphaerales bacterium]
MAPQVSLGGRFMSRPVIRACPTYAGWGDDFEGQFGGADYLTERWGFTHGVQREAGW